jgi:sn-glycerol 3-phosphate transport system ATP-binding protein
MSPVDKHSSRPEAAEVTLADVSKRFGGVTALADVSLTVGRGEFCVVVGPSGCGKSTLLRVIAGLEPVSAGSVRIAGRDVTALPPRSRDVAFVFQSYALYPHLSVRDNLEFPLKVRGVGTVERRRRVAEAAQLLGLGDLLERRPVALSGGQRQRVAMGRALIRRPAVFLFDEPLSNLDARLRERMRVELVELHRSVGTTTVYVTHDQTEAMTLGERVVVMSGGRVLQVGSPRELYDTPADTFVATFLGSPAMNILSAAVHHEGREATARLAGGALLPAPSALPDGDVELGVRAEDLVPGVGPLRLTVKVVEDLGSDRLVHGDVGGQDVVVRLPEGEPAPKPGVERALTVRPGRAHWFVAGRRAALGGR